MDVYLKQHLLKALQKAGLPHSYPTLVRYEQKGIIPSSRLITSKNRKWRVYSEQDIADIVKVIAEYKKIKQ